MHVHWHIVVHQSHSAVYKQCRCGRRKIVELRQDPRHGVFVVAPIDHDWINREDGVAGQADGPELVPPSEALRPGGLPPASIPSDVNFCEDVIGLRREASSKEEFAILLRLLGTELKREDLSNEDRKLTQTLCDRYMELYLRGD